LWLIVLVALLLAMSLLAMSSSSALGGFAGIAEDSSPPFALYLGSGFVAPSPGGVGSANAGEAFALYLGSGFVVPSPGGVGSANAGEAFALYLGVLKQRAANSLVFPLDTRADEPEGVIAPTNLVANPQACTDIVRLTWFDNSPDETGFEVEAKYSGFSDIWYERLVTLPEGTTSYDARPIELYGLPVTYRVRAVRELSKSAYTNEAMATHGSLLPGYVPPPAGITAKSIGNSRDILVRIRPPSDNQSGWGEVESVVLWVATNQEFDQPEVIVLAPPEGGGVLEHYYSGSSDTDYWFRVSNASECAGDNTETIEPGAQPVRPSPPPVLLIHGISGSTDNWGSVWDDGFASREYAAEGVKRAEFQQRCGTWYDWGKELKHILTSLLEGDWQTDEKVDLIAHSQGGLASRHLIETSDLDFVRGLVMIGTPNHGGRFSTLLTFGPGLSDALLCRKGVEALQANSPHLRELNFGDVTTKDDHCWDEPEEIVNSRRGSARYLSIAGLGPSKLSCIPPKNLLCLTREAKFGPVDPEGCQGDGVVTWKSARLRASGTPLVTLSGHAHNALLSMPGSNGSVALLESPVVVNTALDWLDTLDLPDETAASRPVDPAGALGVEFYEAVQEVSPDSVVHHSSVVDSVHGDVRHHEASIDSCGSLVLFAGWPDLEATLSIMSPDSVIYSAGDTLLYSWLEYEVDMEWGYSSFLVRDPEPGPWTAVVTREPGSPVLPFTLDWVIVNGSYRLLAWMGGEVARPGETVPVHASLMQGGASVLASVVATVQDPNGEFMTITLHDDGTGGDEVGGDLIYTGLLDATSADGFHNVTVEGRLEVPGPEGILRTVETGFHVVATPELVVQEVEHAPVITQVNRLSELRVRIANIGPAPADSVDVLAMEVTSGDTLGTVRVGIPAQDSTSVHFLWTPVVAGEYHLNVSVSLLGFSELDLADNSLGIVVPVSGVPQTVSVDPDPPSINPLQFVLGLPRPNPSRGRVALDFVVPHAANVLLEVYDVRGRRVRTIVDEMCAPGSFTRYWDGVTNTGRTAASGVYFIRFAAPGTELRRKVVLLRGSAGFGG
jgi:pimeloyl-ACP methyl ester carboxylesterase